MIVKPKKGICGDCGEKIDVFSKKEPWRLSDEYIKHLKLHHPKSIKIVYTRK